MYGEILSNILLCNCVLVDLSLPVYVRTKKWLDMVCAAHAVQRACKHRMSVGETERKREIK